MLKKFTLSLLLGCFMLCSSMGQAQTVITSEFLVSYSLEDMNDILNNFLGGVASDLPLPVDVIIDLLGLEYGVDMYKVTYNTTHPVLGNTIGTGVLSIPQGFDPSCELPLAIYQHGTTFNVNGVPSHLSDEHYLGALLSSSGYAAVLPDYLGLGGVSPGMHPYVHAQTAADAAIDLMRSARELTDDYGFSLNGQNFIFGYSQGGHAAMALFYELETYHSDEFTVTAAAPMSGPYDISVTQESVMWQEYETPRYLPYVLIGYQSVYPELAAYTDIFKEEFDGINNFTGDTQAFFDSLNTMDVPSIPIEMIKPEFVAEYVADDNHPLRVAMRDNDRYDWLPQAPMQILGCCDDEQVNYQNAVVAYDKFIENGADPDNLERFDFCQLFPGSMPFRHGGCLPFCLLWGKQFFDSYKTDCATGITGAVDRSLSFHPNPARNTIAVDVPLTLPGPYQLRMSDISGKTVLARDYGMDAGFELNVNIAGLESGLYIIELQGRNGTHQSKVMVQ